MIDLVITGDRVVTPHDIGPADVAIGGGKVVAVAARGGFPVPAGARSVDATGKIVMPGGIDPHTHCLWPIPGPDGAVSLTQGPSVVGRAALHGGTTTIIDFTRWTHGHSVQEAIEARMAQWREDGCACDWALHTMVEGDLPPEVPAQLGEAIEAGHATVKIFTTDITPSRRGRMVDFGDIWEVFQALAKHGGLGVIHAEDNDIVMHMYAKLFREGRVGFENMAEVHNTLSEDLSFRRVMRLAERVPGTALYMMHVSAGGRGAGDPRGARQEPARLRRVAAPVHALHAGGLPAAERPDVPHLSLAQVAGGPGRAVARHARRLDRLRRHGRALLLPRGEDAGQAHRRHHGRQCRASSRASPSSTPRWWASGATR